MQLTFSEKAPIMPQYATGNAAKEAGVRARFLFHTLFTFLFFACISMLRIDYQAAHDYHAGVWIGFREHAQP